MQYVLMIVAIIFSVWVIYTNLISIIGLGITGWGVYQWRKNKKDYVKSSNPYLIMGVGAIILLSAIFKVGYLILGIGVIFAVVGFVAIFYYLFKRRNKVKVSVAQFLLGCLLIFSGYWIEVDQKHEQVNQEAKEEKIEAEQKAVEKEAKQDDKEKEKQEEK